MMGIFPNIKLKVKVINKKFISWMNYLLVNIQIMFKIKIYERINKCLLFWEFAEM